MFNEGQSQLKIINENPNNISIINGRDSSKFHFICLIIRIFYNNYIINIIFFVIDNEYQLLLGNNLNFKSLILQRTWHEAYYSKPLEQKIKKPSSSGLNSSNSIMPNRVSNLVSFFLKNEDSH